MFRRTWTLSPAGFQQSLRRVDVFSSSPTKALVLFDVELKQQIRRRSLVSQPFVNCCDFTGEAGDRPQKVVLEESGSVRYLR